MSRDSSVTSSSESSLPHPPTKHVPNPFSSLQHQFRSPFLAAFLGTSYTESADVGILCAVIFGVCLLFAIAFCVCRANSAFNYYGRRNRKPMGRAFNTTNAYQQQQQQPYVLQHQPQQQYTVDNQGRVVQGRPNLQYEWQQWGNAHQQPPPPHFQQHNPFQPPHPPPVYFSHNMQQQQHPPQPSQFPPPYSSNSTTQQSSSLVPEACLPRTDSASSTTNSSYSSNSATRPIPPPIRIPGGYQPHAIQQQHQKEVADNNNPFRPQPSAPSYRALPHVNTEKHLLQEMHPKPSLMPVAQPVKDLSARKYSHHDYDNHSTKTEDATIERSTSSREPRSSELRRSELGVPYPGQRNHHGEEQPRTLAK